MNGQTRRWIHSKRAPLSRSACMMVRRGENGVLGGLWLEGHGLLEGPEVLGLSYECGG